MLRRAHACSQEGGEKKESKFNVYGDDFKSSFSKISGTKKGGEILSAIENDPNISSVFIGRGHSALGVTKIRGSAVMVEGTKPAWWQVWKVPRYTNKYEISIDINMLVSDPTFIASDGSPFVPSLTRVLAHELGHAYNFQSRGRSFSGHNSIKIENQIMRELNPDSIMRHSDQGHGRSLGF